MIHGILSGEAPMVRERIWPFLENFAQRSHGRWTPEDLFAAIRCADKQLWVVQDFQAVLLTSVGQDWVNIDHCAGSGRAGWQQAIDDEICAWARSMGKKRVFALTRPGWAKYGKLRGYREIHREFVKEL